MQIIYVSVMVAIFVLCLALLSTARRILHSTPLTSGQLSISRAYDLDSPEIEALPNTGSAEIPASIIQVAYADSDFPVAEPVMPKAVAAPLPPEILPAQTMDAKSLFQNPLAPITQAPVPNAAPKKSANLLPVKKALGMRKPSRRAYNYAFECLLLGVSAVVLIKTQRGVVRYRGSHPRVA